MDSVETVARCIRRSGLFLRRRDLLKRGFSDTNIREALESRSIFRVRQGWYSIPDAPTEAVRAVRVGGRLTGLSALLSFGLRVPRRDFLHVAVPAQACRLRNPDDRRARLSPTLTSHLTVKRGAENGHAADVSPATQPPPVQAVPPVPPVPASQPPQLLLPHVPPPGSQSRGSAVVVSWTDRPRTQHGWGAGATSWRVSIDDAVLAVLVSEHRDIAVACVSAVLHQKRWSARRTDELFERAPAHARCWRYLVSGLDESHGETFVRLWLRDAGFNFESQPIVPGVGRLDGRVSPHVYVEVDGAQHDPNWTGEGESSYEKDRGRDLAMLLLGGRTIRITYRLLYGSWGDCVAAITRAVEDDAELSARRSRHPPPQRAFDTFRTPRKRRRKTPTGPNTGS
ncbi:MAG: hypothetical protein ACOH1J_08710 [Microbacteriaceae bacterium]